MDWLDAKKMLGSYGPWPKDSPPKLVKQDIAREIPNSFDARTKWPGFIHAIRNQVQSSRSNNSSVSGMAQNFRKVWSIIIKLFMMTMTYFHDDFSLILLFFHIHWKITKPT